MKYRLWVAACSLWPFWGVHRDATEATGPYLNKYRVGGLVLASSLALLFGLGVRSASADAWGKCGSSTFPATGQTTSHPPMLKITDAPVRDDGVVQAGGALAYQNNGDGTITDLNTGLMWEQKIRDPVAAKGLHDVTLILPWDSAATTIWDWLEEVNTEGGIGLGGHNDWRIPNVKELMSIVDYGTSNPAVAEAFNNDPGALATCNVFECSLTASDFYWSSTTNAAVPADAWLVDFNIGSVNAAGKFNTAFVRAVRGGCVH